MDYDVQERIRELLMQRGWTSEGADDFLRETGWPERVMVCMVCSEEAPNGKRGRLAFACDRCKTRPLPRSVNCEFCQISFAVKIKSGKRSRFCSLLCRERDGRGVTLREVCCARCSASFVTAKAIQAYCSKDCQVAADRAKPRKQKRTAKTRAREMVRVAQKRMLPYESFTTVEIAERDEWTCGLCAEPIDQELRWPEPWSLSLDHVLPLSRGGSHTRENAQAAHLRCNLVKGARVLESV